MVYNAVQSLMEIISVNIEKLKLACMFPLIRFTFA